MPPLLVSLQRIPIVFDDRTVPVDPFARQHLAFAAVAARQPSIEADFPALVAPATLQD